MQVQNKKDIKHKENEKYIHDDFELIVHKLPRELKEIRILGIADLHKGARECNLKRWEMFEKTVLSSPNNYVVIAGDMMNNATKGGKSNTYEDIEPPSKQKLWLINNLERIKDRILCVVEGNHEHRSGKEVDNHPLFDVCCSLGIDKLYRSNGAFMKISLGTRQDQKAKQVSYTALVHHGASERVMEAFNSIVENVDIVWTGHVHKGGISRPGKIIIDDKNECIRFSEYVPIKLTSFLDYGSYAFKQMLRPHSNKKTIIAQLNGEYKDVTTIW